MAPKNHFLILCMDTQKSKKIYFDVIPKSVDEYLTQIKNFVSQSDEERLNNPLLYVHNIQPSEMPKENITIPFSLLIQPCFCMPCRRSRDYLGLY